MNTSLSVGLAIVDFIMIGIVIYGCCYRTPKYIDDAEIILKNENHLSYYENT